VLLVLTTVILFAASKLLRLDGVSGLNRSGGSAR